MAQKTFIVFRVVVHLTVIRGGFREGALGAAAPPLKPSVCIMAISYSECVSNMEETIDNL